jgi:hypothetical protein
MAVYKGPKWQLRALRQQWWSFAGDGDPYRVSKMFS